MTFTQILKFTSKKEGMARKQERENPKLTIEICFLIIIKILLLLLNNINILLKSIFCFQRGKYRWGTQKRPKTAYLDQGSRQHIHLECGQCIEKGPVLYLNTSKKSIQTT